jgi:LPS-assembly lipoprotein
MRKLLPVLGLTLMLGGCAGFQPLYGQPQVVSGLAGIQVEAPSGRTGYLMRQHLDDAFAHDASAPRSSRCRAATWPSGVRFGWS